MSNITTCLNGHNEYVAWQYIDHCKNIYSLSHLLFLFVCFFFWPTSALSFSPTHISIVQKCKTYNTNISHCGRQLDFLPTLFFFLFYSSLRCVFFNEVLYWCIASVVSILLTDFVTKKEAVNVWMYKKRERKGVLYLYTSIITFGWKQKSNVFFFCAQLFCPVINRCGHKTKTEKRTMCYFLCRGIFCSLFRRPLTINHRKEWHVTVSAQFVFES